MSTIFIISYYFLYLSIFFDKNRIFYLIAVVVTAVMVSCANNENNNSSQTGAIDQNGNIITITNTVTNVIGDTSDSHTDYYRIYVTWSGGGDYHTVKL